MLKKDLGPNNSQIRSYRNTDHSLDPLGTGKRPTFDSLGTNQRLNMQGFLFSM